MCSNHNRCAYCNAVKLRIGMTQVPSNVNRLKDWIDVLGPDFEKRCNGKLCSYICLSHFAVLKKGRRPKNAIPRPLPFYNNALDEKIDRHNQRITERSEKTVGSNLENVNMLVCTICGMIYKNESETTEYLKSFVCNLHYYPQNQYFMDYLLSMLPQKALSNNEQLQEPKDDDIQIIEAKIVGEDH